MINYFILFGLGMFVVFNLIDFSKVLVGFKNVFEIGNVVVMFMILFLLLLYVLFVIWVWRIDRKDVM